MLLAWLRPRLLALRLVAAGTEHDFGTVAQAIEVICGHHSAGGEVNLRNCPVGGPNINRVHLDGLVGLSFLGRLYQIYERRIGISLYGRIRKDRDVGEGIYQEPDIDELIRETKIRLHWNKRHEA